MFIGILVATLIIVGIVAISRSSRKTKIELDELKKKVEKVE